MVNILEPIPVSATRHPNLLLHCGAKAVSRRAVQKVVTPFPTDTWTPIPHMELIQRVEHTLKSNRLTIGTQAHSLGHEGMRYFGLMEIKGRATDADYCWVLGLRNSHDKTFPAGIVAGSSVFCCDNLAFSGEVKLARKHTRYINRDLPFLVQQAIGRLLDKWHDQDVRIDAYRNTALKDRGAHDLIIRATDVGACSNRMVPTVLHEWRESKYEQFQERNVWNLFNAFTEALKEGDLAVLPKRTEALHGLMDSHVGLAFGRN
jgi:hypothetical protein